MASKGLSQPGAIGRVASKELNILWPLCRGIERRRVLETRDQILALATRVSKEQINGILQLPSVSEVQDSLRVQKGCGSSEDDLRFLRSKATWEAAHCNRKHSLLCNDEEKNGLSEIQRLATVGPKPMGVACESRVLLVVAS